MTETIHVILSEPRPGDAEQQELVDFVVNALAGRQQIGLTVIPHLYDLEPGGPTMDFLRQVEGPLVVISWLYPRAAFWTLKTAGLAGRFENGQTERQDRERPVWCLGLHTRVDPKTILDDVDRIVAGNSPRAAAEDARTEPDRKLEDTRERWYPVIDRDRCSGCLECLNFCLFGVYGMDSADDLLIEQPDACRAGCPACSRICPEAAIMFPQHADPAISGDDKASLSGLQLDLSQLFSGADPSSMAIAERDRALSQAASGDQLDDLVDELDEMDI